jgi:hypothetical protein
VPDGEDILNHVLGEFADLSAVSDLRRPLITIRETGDQILKTAADQIAVIGTLSSGATASIHIREAVSSGTGSCGRSTEPTERSGSPPTPRSPRSFLDRLGSTRPK